jgi:catechol 2,3-dioxygenase-like lactoylglutathione lyase family enzyme
MAKIRHIAVMSNDTAKLADFYKTTFGMEEVWRHQSSSGPGAAIYLTDGYINMAVLPARGRPEGLNHFGFEVDDKDQLTEAAVKAGAGRPDEALPRDGRYAETYICDPSGQRIDLSEKGWKTAAGAGPVG